MEFSGRTAAEAAIKACEHFGVARSELKYSVVSDEGADLNRKVVIKAEVDAQAPRRPEGDDRGGDRGGSSDRGDRGGGDRGGRDRYESRGGGRDRGDRGGRGGGRGGWGGGGGGDRDGARRRGRRGGRSRGDRDSRRGGPGPGNSDGIESLLNLDLVPAQRNPPAPEITGTLSPRAQKGIAVVREMLPLLGFSLTAHVVRDEGEEIHIDLRGTDEAQAIGKKGETLLALQFIVNRIVSRGSEEGEGEEGQVVVLDAADYRGRRKNALADLAKKLATRAVQEKKVVRLSPMSPHDRRVFHLTLQEMAGVETRSEGEGLYRNLLIIPKVEADQEGEAGGEEAAD